LEQLAHDRRAAKLHIDWVPAKAGIHSSTTQTSAEMGPGLRRDLDSISPTEFWIAAERLPQFLALWPNAGLDPAIAAPAGYAEERCERRLLARIHRYTLRRLRAEIEPVAARDFLRFLFEWQRVTEKTRMEGPDALAAVLGQLEGFEAAAGAWETEILAARVAEYEPAWLDDHCLAGRTAWTRLRPRNPRPEGDRGGANAPGPVRTTPITFLARRHAPS